MADLTPEDVVKQGLIQTQLDPQAAADMAAYQKSVTNTTPGILNGVGGAGAGVQSPAVARFAKALGGSDQSSLLDALKTKNTNSANDFIGTLKRDTTMTAPIREQAGFNQARQNTAAASAYGIKNYQTQLQQSVNEQRLKIYRQQQQDSILGSIFGIIGAIGGGALGAVIGGPAGAAAGAAAGSKAGG